jgi:large subunit ribosomal protein L28
MSKECFYCGKTKVAGKTHSRKGLEKKKGGTGSKIARVNKRDFLPNLQKIRVLVDKTPKTVFACTKCLKAGKVKKYVKTKRPANP